MDSWASLNTFLHSISEEEAIAMIMLVKERGHELSGDDRANLKERYACLREPQNGALHVMLTEVYGPIDKGDPKAMKEPLPAEEGTMEVKKKT